MSRREIWVAREEIWVSSQEIVLWVHCMFLEISLVSDFLVLSFWNHSVHRIEKYNGRFS